MNVSTKSREVRGVDVGVRRLVDRDLDQLGHEVGVVGQRGVVHAQRRRGEEAEQVEVAGAVARVDEPGPAAGVGVQHEVESVDEQVTAERLVDAVRSHSHVSSVRAGKAQVTTPGVGVDRRSATMSSVAPTNRQLDELDHRLLELLAVDGRATMSDLGRAVGLSRTAVLARVQRLEQTGVIRGYRAEVVLPGPSPAAHRARVGLVIQTTDVAGYVRRLAALPGVTEVETVAGEYDLIVLITAPDSAELDRGARHGGGLARDPPDHDVGGAEALHLTAPGTAPARCVGARVDHRSPLP